MLFSFLLLQTAIAVPVPSPAVTPSIVAGLRPNSKAQEQSGSDIIVVGRTFRETEERLRRCLARKCPPLADIAASMDHAENQFMAGDYQGANVTLGRARGRNGRYAQEFPVQVGNLIQFKSDVSSLIGFGDVSRVSAIDALSALKAGLAPDDIRIERQRLVIGDAFVRQGRIRAGSDVYDAVARRAHESGRSALEGEAMLRGAALYGGLAEVLPEYTETADRRFAELSATTDPAMKLYRGAISLYKARLAYRRGDSRPLDQLVSNVDARTDKAIMIVEPPMDLKMDGVCDVYGKYNLSQQWIDYDFNVAPDGRVNDIVERRRGKNAEDHWIERVKTSLSQRRYLPLEPALAATGIPRRERFSLVSEVEPQTNSRILSSCGRPRVISVDLSQSDTASPAG